MSFSTIITDMRSKRIPVIRKPLLNQESDFTLDNLETKPTVWKCLSAFDPNPLSCCVGCRASRIHTLPVPERLDLYMCGPNLIKIFVGSLVWIRKMVHLYVR